MLTSSELPGVCYFLICQNNKLGGKYYAAQFILLDQGQLEGGHNCPFVLL